MFSMKPIDEIGKHLPQKRKALLHCLRKHNWEVTGVDDSQADWALDVKWMIESTRESKGAKLTLWFFKYDGVHDGMNRVVATPRDASQPRAYGGEPSLDFDARGFEAQLQTLMTSLHTYRINGRLAVSEVEEKRKT
jgi:hypothetical protein